MHAAGLMILALSCVFVACTCGDKGAPDSKSGHEQDSPNAGDSDYAEVSALPSGRAFVLSTYMDTAAGEPERIAAGFLHAFLMQGDYLSALDFLCEANRGLVENDSVMRYVIYDRDNPAWDGSTRFRYELTRRYIPVLARFNDISLIRRLSCDSVCRLEYEVTGPLRILKLFQDALGENGKELFDTYVDSPVALEKKQEFYDYAFTRLTKMADSVDYIKLAISDTLLLIREGGAWKVCRQVASAPEIFMRK